MCEMLGHGWVPSEDVAEEAIGDGMRWEHGPPRGADRKETSVAGGKNGQRGLIGAKTQAKC